MSLSDWLGDKETKQRQTGFWEEDLQHKVKHAKEGGAAELCYLVYLNVFITYLVLTYFYLLNIF